MKIDYAAKRPRTGLAKVIIYLFMFFLTIIILIPIAWVIISSFKNPEEINRPVSLPSSFYIDNYIKIFNNELILTGLVNSIVITLGSLLIGVLIATLAGYAIGRRKEKIFNFVYLIFLSSLAIPTGSNLITLYSLMKTLGLVNSRLGLVLLYSAGMIPLGILIYTGFVKNIPKELDEAATVDGCGFFKRYWLIILPLLRPAILTHSLISSIGIWNDFLLPLLLITTNDKKPLTLAVYAYQVNHLVDVGAINALLVFAIIPPILVFIFLQKYFYSGITAGAVKG